LRRAVFASSLQQSRHALQIHDWHRRRDMIRTLVQRIEIGLEVIKIVFRVTQEARGSGPESIVVTLPRM
jgi:hypothetical protein